MPKTIKKFKSQISTLVTDDSYFKLIAIGYFFGHKNGKYASVLRDFVSDCIERFEKGLTPKQKKQYAEILSNVQLMGKDARVKVSHSDLE